MPALQKATFGKEKRKLKFSHDVTNVIKCHAWTHCLNYGGWIRKNTNTSSVNNWCHDEFTRLCT